AEFNNKDSLKRLVDTFGLTYNLLETHAHSEDSYVEPLVKECNADTAVKLADAHQRLEKDISTLLARVEGLDAQQEDATEQGRSLYLDLSRFVGEYLQHIADEEQIVSPLLWEHFDDQKLMEVSATIRANLPPPVMGNFLSLMIPAMNHNERVIMFSGMKQAAPPEVFDGVCKLGQNVLAAADWERLDNTINS
ncbi:MAG: hemerythrin domain-containing protein, partial [Gammaproteobacteria bacterium]|nr:hemerythrin domain-containing protein [Gammaproteobacteria bacterium]